MAFTNFYVNPSGSDLNAGSTAVDAGGTDTPLVTYAGGTWVAGTGVFTVASGNPVTDGVTVGMLASVYTTAAAVTTKCVGVLSGVSATTVTVNTAQIWGAAANASATAGATTCKVGGAWASEATVVAFTTVTVPLATKIHIKAATYTVAASRSIGLSGTTLLPCWIDGYHTTPGDLDADTTNSLTKPVLAFGSFTLGSTGAFLTLSNLSITSTVAGNAWSHTGGASLRLWRVRVENTSANAAAVAFSTTANQFVFAYCWFKTPTTATTNATVVLSILNVNATLLGCVFEGSGRAGCSVVNTGDAVPVVQCVFLNNTGVGLLLNNTIVALAGCTFASPTADGVKWTAAPGASSTIVGCVFSSCAGVGINNASGTNTGNVFRAANDFYNCGTNEVGFGDVPAIYGQTESSAVLTSSTDMTPVVGSNARGHGFPGVFENQSYSSPGSAIGAVDPAATAGGGETSSVFGA